MADWVTSATIYVVAILSSWTEAYLCPKEQDTCEIWLEVAESLTMLTHIDGVPRPVKVINNTLYAVTSLPEEDIINLLPLKGEVKEGEIIQEVDPKDVVTADGYPKHKLVYLVNGTLPGPKLEVYEGQNLTIHVHNKLLAEVLTIHWHGMHQRGTPEMDGVPFVSQDPIMPGQKFTYKFTASPAGTHYYHSLVGMQTSMGVYGALIVHPQISKHKFAADYTLVLSEWNHDWTGAEAYTRYKYSAAYTEGDTYNGTTSPTTGDPHGTRIAHSILVNGKARFRNRKTGQVIENPLADFFMIDHANHLFRIINACSHTNLLITIEGHSMKVWKTDGHDSSRKLVRGIYLTAGERYDVVVRASPRHRDQQFAILIKSAETPNEIYGEAILKYGNAPKTPLRVAHDLMHCSSMCYIENCPTTFYPITRPQKCLNKNTLSTLNEKDPAPAIADAAKFKEFFLNFGHVFDTYPEEGSVNGKVMKTPPKALLSHPGQSIACESTDCAGKPCHCTHTIHYCRNDVVQLVLLNIGQNLGVDHAIHLHGHSFHIMEYGSPKYSYQNRKFVLTGPSALITCIDEFCTDAKWSYNISGADIHRVEGPIKDTVNVPGGGYVVVRFRAHNPGFWALRSQHEVLGAGMTVILAEDMNCRNEDGDKKEDTSNGDDRGSGGRDSGDGGQGSGNGGQGSGDGGQDSAAGGKENQEKECKDEEDSDDDETGSEGEGQGSGDGGKDSGDGGKGGGDGGQGGGDGGQGGGDGGQGGGDGGQGGGDGGQDSAAGGKGNETQGKECKDEGEDSDDDGTGSEGEGQGGIEA